MGFLFIEKQSYTNMIYRISAAANTRQMIENKKTQRDLEYYHLETKHTEVNKYHFHKKYT
jgi:hypothetical protein